MANIWLDAKDKNVAAIEVFGDSSKAYKDAEYTTQFTTSELKDAFIKGALIIVSDVMYKPASLEVADGVATINYVTGGESVAVAGLAAVADAE